MLKKKLLGIMILLVGIMLVFAVIGCNDDDSKDKLKDDDSKPDGGIGAITSLSVKTKGIKSLYAGNVAVTGNSIGRAIVNGNGEVLTLSFIDENGKNAPVVFTDSSGKQYMLEIVGMEKIDNTRIIVGYNGIYEVTAGDDGKIVVGTKEARTLNGALIDMKSGRVYEFEGVKIWNNPKNSVNMFGHRMWFIENNICYFADGWPDSTVYKIDLTAASPKKVPLSNGAFVRIDEARPAFTIDGRIIGIRWDDDGGWKLYSVETNGTGWRTVERPDYADVGGFLLTIPEGASEEIDYDVTLYNSTPCSLIMKDLSGNTWLYTIFVQDEEEKKCHAGLWSWGTKYLITQLHVDNTGKFEASNISTGDIVFEAKHDEYWYDNYGDAKMDYLPFYINDVGIALSFLESPNGDSDHRKPEAFLHNGVYLLNTKGFIKITKKQNGNGIEQTSVALNIPKVTRKTAVISKDGYLYWVEGNVGVKRLKLESGAATEDVYSNSNVIADANTNAPRDYLTVSGGDTLVFYMSSVGSKVYTYALDLKDPKHSSAEILAENDIEIKAVAELSF
ncbi:MAG: hypothetical protein LBC76_09575 [Treponema sp.]|jgi:hypothetical protein|nr:hypothetical protein [Treponema sp.]